jgi:hypothetical protein
MELLHGFFSRDRLKFAAGQGAQNEEKGEHEGARREQEGAEGAEGREQIGATERNGRLARE